MIKRLFVFLMFTLHLGVSVGSSATTATPPQFYESYGSYMQCWNGTTSCRVNFAKTPSNANLVLIRNVSCYIEASVPLRTIYLGVSTTPGGNVTKSQYVPFVPYTIGSSFYYTISADTYFYVGGDRYPTLGILSLNPGTSFVQCSISGDVVSP